MTSKAQSIACSECELLLDLTVTRPFLRTPAGAKPQGEGRSAADAMFHVKHRANG
jgi:hypothetical protein